MEVGNILEQNGNAMVIFWNYLEMLWWHLGMALMLNLNFNEEIHGGGTCTLSSSWHLLGVSLN